MQAPPSTPLRLRGSPLSGVEGRGFITTNTSGTINTLLCVLKQTI